MSTYVCDRCKLDLSSAIRVLGREGVQILHQAAHTREDLEATRKQLHELQRAGKAIIDGWEKNLSDPVQELAGLVPEVTECPWCGTFILDPTTTKQGECPHCSHNLIKLLNKYHCEDCNTKWEDTWSCAVDNECPRCNADISPYNSEEVGEE